VKEGEVYATSASIPPPDAARRSDAMSRAFNAYQRDFIDSSRVSDDSPHRGAFHRSFELQVVTFNRR
jgi:hypothetical protein